MAKIGQWCIDILIAFIVTALLGAVLVFLLGPWLLLVQWVIFIGVLVWLRRYRRRIQN